MAATTSSSAAASSHNQSWSQRLQTIQKNIRVSPTGGDGVKTLVSDLGEVDCELEKFQCINSVFIGGAQNIKQSIIQRLKQLNPWIEMSNITVQVLCDQYKNDRNLMLNHMYNGRTEPKIYVMSDQELKLYDEILVQYYWSAPMTVHTLKKVYNDCCNVLNESSTSRTVMIVDCRREYFAQHPNNQQQYQLFLQLASYAAIMSKRHLYPFIEFIIIRDSEKTESSNIIHDPEAYQYLRELIEQVSCTQIDTILYTLDIERICQIIAYTYKSTY